jgi:hypothetical protein
VDRPSVRYRDRTIWEDAASEPRAMGRTRQLLLVWAGGALAFALLGYGVPALSDDPAGWAVGRNGRRLLEAWVLGGLLVTALRGLPLERMLPRRLAVLASVVVAGILVAQLSLGRFASYPFPDWGMYTRPAPTVTYLDVVAVRGDEEFPLPLHHVPTTSIRAFLTRLGQAVEVADERPDVEADLGRFARHALEVSGTEADRVEFRWCHTRGEAPGIDTTCEPHLTVEP